jgi:hypothetical protein
VADLLELACASFDAEAAHVAYRSWEESGEEEHHEEAFLRALPATGVIFFRAGFTSMSSAITPREFIGSAALSVYNETRKRSFRGSYVEQYAKWLYSISRNSFIDELREWSSRRIFNFDYHGPCTPRGSLYDVQDVEHEIFLRQLPREIVKRVSKAIRFDGQRRLACFHILRQLVSGHEIAERYMRKQFGVVKPDLDFLIDYVTVRVRMALYEIRTDLCHGKVVDDWVSVVDMYGMDPRQVVM